MSLTAFERHLHAVKAAPGRVEGRSAFCGRVEQHGLCTGLCLDAEYRGAACSCPCHAGVDASERKQVR